MVHMLDKRYSYALHMLIDITLSVDMQKSAACLKNAIFAGAVV